MGLSITKELVQEIHKYARINNIKKVLAGISGGPDSVAMLSALLQADLKVVAIHCNFHLRDEESLRDEKFVENLCSSFSISVEIINFDTYDLLKNEKGKSIEMICRDLRYSFFFNKQKEYGCDRIVVGHNADDNIETFFLNLFRGSGTRGLKGMEYDTSLLWRPLLHTHRTKILAFLTENNLNYVIDSSNLKNDYRRNFIRNNIIPSIESVWPGFRTVADKTLENLKYENLIVEKSLDTILIENSSSLSISDIMLFPAPKLLIRRFIEKAGPYNTTADEIYASIKANKPHSRVWKLKKGKIILRNNKLFIEMIHGESCP